MNAAAYVAAGYSITALALGAYWLRLVARLSAARRRSVAVRGTDVVTRRSATAPERQP